MNEQNQSSESDYNWSAISKGAVPAGIGVVLAFANLSSNWRWLIALLCMAAAYGIVSFHSKKKSDLFTALALVFAISIAMHALSTAGFV